MTASVTLVEVWRGPFLESTHQGAAVICDARGDVVEAWGDPQRLVLPRSSSKMIQALPLVESGAAAAHHLTPEHLALACASHSAAEMHTARVLAWLDDIGQSERDLCCGAQEPQDQDARDALIRAHQAPARHHNNCSGKHTGFLTLAKHLKAPAGGYVDIDHPVQRAVREAWERVTGETVAGYGVDGCSAPNLATTLQGVARAMAWFAAASDDSAAGQLRRAMIAYPELVAGEGRSCTNLMRAAGGRVAIKTGAEGFFVGIVPEKQLGIALKIDDGAKRASACALAAILVRLGVLDPDHPITRTYLNAPQHSFADEQTGCLRAAPALC